MKNVVKRGNVYYLRKLVDGKRKFQSLKTRDKAVAEARARPLLKAAYDGRFDILESVASKRSTATLGEVFLVFRAAAKARGLKSAGQYISQLSNIIRKIHGAAFDVEAAAAAILTAELLTKYMAAEFLAAGENVLAQERAKLTIKSTVVNARSVFAKWTAANKIYKGLALPDLRDFKTIGFPWKIEPHVYHRPPDQLITATIAAGRALREKNPRLYAVFLLTYDLALRAGEAMAIEWDWFTPHLCESDIVLHADICRRPHFRPKWNMERSIPLDGATWRELQELRKLPEWFDANGQAIAHVVPGAHATDRYDVVNREFATWMRGLGWNEKNYPKTAHELRKLMGSEWFTKLSPQFAQEKLGHRNIATTCTFYARLAKKPKALPRDDIALPPVQNTAQN